jgi:hypothetical protein
MKACHPERVLVPEAQRAEALSEVEGEGPGRPAPGAGANRARIVVRWKSGVSTPRQAPLPPLSSLARATEPRARRGGRGSEGARREGPRGCPCSESRNFHFPAENSAAASGIVPANSQTGAPSWPRA